MNVKVVDSSSFSSWDHFISNLPHGSHCHLYGWKEVIQSAYRQKPYYLVAEDNGKITGILPLFCINSYLFKSHLVSMPYLNYGGVLASTEETYVALLRQAQIILNESNGKYIQLRHFYSIREEILEELHFVPSSIKKVTLILELPRDSDELFKSFKSKLRSQIRRPTKEGMEAKIGGEELVRDFYKVFSRNMRDLGSPVHSLLFFKKIIHTFGENVRVGVVYYLNKPVASGIIFKYKDRVEIPWASSLKKYNRFSPNMLLYWTFLKYSCDNGYKYFDFGRSTPGEGTYKFKRQWGAEPEPLFWYEYSINKNESEKEFDQSIYMNYAMKIWKKLPVFLTTWLGPMVRKSISL